MVYTFGWETLSKSGTVVVRAADDADAEERFVDWWFTHKSPHVVTMPPHWLIECRSEGV